MTIAEYSGHVPRADFPGSTEYSKNITLSQTIPNIGLSFSLLTPCFLSWAFLDRLGSSTSLKPRNKMDSFPRGQDGCSAKHEEWQASRTTATQEYVWVEGT